MLGIIDIRDLRADDCNAWRTQVREFASKKRAKKNLDKNTYAGGVDGADFAELVVQRAEGHLQLRAL